MLATHRLAPARAAHLLEVRPGEFQSQLKILVLFILDLAEAPHQLLRLLLSLLFERGPVSHGGVSLQKQALRIQLAAC